MLKKLCQYDDWANDRVLQLADKLSDAQLDHCFEMGCVTLRLTLIHIHEATYYWLGVINGDADRAEPPQGEPIVQLWQRWIATRNERDAILSVGTVGRVVQCIDGRGIARSSSVEEILLHTLTHGTHHRAQAVNMLRHLGVEAPRLDYIVMTRELSA